MPEQITLGNSHFITLHSRVTNQTYRISVALPESYNKEGSTTAYPVIFKLDGQWDFLLAASTYNVIRFDGQMPEAIVAGIDWGDVEGDIHAIRARDLLPAPPSFYPEGGQAKKFVQALVEEIFPQLESRYRLNDTRVLLGGSWGAIFATYALLERPDFFTGAIAIAGGYGIVQGEFENLIRGLDGTHKLDGRRLYLAAGSWDPLTPDVVELANLLKQAELAGLALKFDQFAGFGHSGVNIPGYAAGYQHMFWRPDVKLAQEALARWAGTYRDLKNNSELHFIATPTGLQVKLPRGEKLALKAESTNEFYHPGMWFKARFEEDSVEISEPWADTTLVRSNVGP